MVNPDRVAGQALSWAPSAAATRAYELHAGAGGEAIGTLAWRGGTLAAANIGAGHWTFKREGFWHPRVTVRAAGSEADLATFRPGWASMGALELSPARHIEWTAADLRRSRWTWREVDGRPLVHVERHRGWNRLEGAIDIEPAAAGLPETPLLVALGWYLLVLLDRDTTRAAVVAATS